MEEEIAAIDLETAMMETRFEGGYVPERLENAPMPNPSLIPERVMESLEEPLGERHITLLSAMLRADDFKGIDKRNTHLTTMVRRLHTKERTLKDACSMTRQARTRLSGTLADFKDEAEEICKFWERVVNWEHYLYEHWIEAEARMRVLKRRKTEADLLYVAADAEQEAELRKRTRAQIEELVVGFRVTEAGLKASTETLQNIQKNTSNRDRVVGEVRRENRKLQEQVQALTAAVKKLTGAVRKGVVAGPVETEPCPVCFEKYGEETEGVRVIQVELPCTHEICKTCTLAIMNGAARANCPICRAVFTEFEEIGGASEN